MKTKSDFNYEIKDDIIVINDLNKGNCSVTNDIENILACIRRNESAKITPNNKDFDLDKYFFIYKDSEGIYDGVLVKNNKFFGFIPLQVKTEEEAIEKIKSITNEKREGKKRTDEFAKQLSKQIGLDVTISDPSNDFPLKAKNYNATKSNVGKLHKIIAFPIETYQLDNGPIVYHFIKSGFKNQYFVLYEDAYFEEKSLIGVLTKEEIEEKYNVKLEI